MKSFWSSSKPLQLSGASADCGTCLVTDGASNPHLCEMIWRVLIFYEQGVGGRRRFPAQLGGEAAMRAYACVRHVSSR